MTQPAADLGDGNLKVAWVPTLADPANPTATELNAAGVVDLSCYLTGDGFNPTTDEQVVTDNRLCSRQTYEQPGRYTDKLEIKYVYRQQDPSASDNKAFTTLRYLTNGYVVSRWGAPYEDAFAAADVVDVVPARCGRQMKQPKEDNATLKLAQKIFITGPVQQDATVAA
jgi:hypothetical protein